MIKVSAAEFQRNIGRYTNAAMTQPVIMTRNGRERTVTVSIEEYRRLKRQDRQVLRLEDISDEMLAAVEASEPSPEAEAFNHEFKG